MDAMYLAGMVADGSKMTRAQLQSWAEGAVGIQMISESTVPWVTVENPAARDLALEWMKADNGVDRVLRLVYLFGAAHGDSGRQIGSQGDRSDSRQDREGDFRREERGQAQMNGFVISVGTYVKPLLAEAKR